MKSILQIAVFGLLLALSNAVVVHPARADGPEPRVERLEQLAGELRLTEEQKAAIGPILRRQAEDYRALQADTSLRRMQKMRRAKEINQKASAAIRAHLDPEQQTKYDALRAEMRKEVKSRAKERKSAAGAP